MKLSELNKVVADLKEARDALHAELHALLAKPEYVALKAQETEIRKQIRECSDLLYPMEMERAEIDRITKGQPRKREEPWLEEEVTLG